MKKQIAKVLAGVLALSMLTACAPKTNAPADPEGSKAPVVATDDQVLTIGLAADPQTVDPQALLSGATTAVIANLYSRLLTRDDDMKIQKDLVTDYKILDDTTWTFTLREDAKFHDGTKLTANDVKFSIERAAKDDTLMEYPHWKNVKQVDVIDDYHFNIITHEPYPALEALLSKSGGDILPKAYIEEVGMDGFLKAPIGSGAYKFVSYVKDESMVMEPNMDYYGEVNKSWKQVVFRVIPEASTRVGELLSGGVDIINNVSPNEWDRINGNEGTSVQQGEGTRCYMLGMKCSEGNETADVRVRQAIDYAIDDKLIVDQVLRGAGTPTLTRVAPGVVGIDESLYGKYNYDVEKAKALLKEAGYENGFELTLEGPNGRYTMDGDICQVIASMLGEVGIKVDLKLYDSTTYVNILSPRKFTDAAMYCFGDNFFDGIYAIACYTPDFSMGETDYNNPEVNELYSSAMANMNLDERIGQIQKAQQIAAVEVPYANILNLKIAYGVRDGIQFAGRLDEVFNLNTITLAK
ncbi:MAG: ABC transporter substrate-binding protein [Oscillospiraceae bacterium]